MAVYCWFDRKLVVASPNFIHRPCRQPAMQAAAADQVSNLQTAGKQSSDI